jgi:hypothetical protein
VKNIKKKYKKFPFQPAGSCRSQKRIFVSKPSLLFRGSVVSFSECNFFFFEFTAIETGMKFSSNVLSNMGTGWKKESGNGQFWFQKY